MRILMMFFLCSGFVFANDNEFSVHLINKTRFVGASFAVEKDSKKIASIRYTSSDNPAHYDLKEKNELIARGYLKYYSSFGAAIPDYNEIDVYDADQKWIGRIEAEYTTKKPIEIDSDFSIFHFYDDHFAYMGYAEFDNERNVFPFYDAKGDFLGEIVNSNCAHLECSVLEEVIDSRVLKIFGAWILHYPNTFQLEEEEY